jgi:multiple sugar transport system permease protein
MARTDLPRSILPRGALNNYDVLSSGTFWGWLSVLPVLLLYTLVAVIPVLFAVYASLHRIPLTDPNWTFVGLENYWEVIQLQRFQESFWRGTLFMVGSTALQLVVGVWIALVLNQLSGRIQKVVSSIVFNAYLVPTITLVLVMLFMLDPYVGVLHQWGTQLGVWENYLFGNTGLALPAVILIGSWKFSVFITIFTFAQLRSIPDRFYEAAKINGANTFQMFRDVTLPRIKGAILVAVLLRSVFMFNKFDLIWMLTQGGPGYSTTTLPVLAYRQTFLGGAYGLGNAMAVIMFLFLTIGGTLYFLVFNPSQEVET